ncbi:alpha/beta hydrolase [Humisphaera borealis]|uniref:Alpha/beta hydrolase n=1 Tax=Humisphaera borealis TaxID=2807512 RepID=A0A7M2WWS2_9BACT|nr:alpha/beta hydrolase [Humisphaera borealis]QOV89853.1 alpha/beta hydrolase [Humisphaera borealis]
MSLAHYRSIAIAAALSLTFAAGVHAADGAKPAEPAPPAAAKPQRAKPAGRDNLAYPPKLDGAEVQVYKTIGDVKLNAYIYKPADWKASDKRPAIVFFFGGGWTSGSPGQFEQHCKHLASRGMMAITADYRVKSRQGVTPVECVNDAKSAVRWARANAEKLGIDPDRIAAGGGSAGGHIAACTGVLDTFDDAAEDAKISSKPNAMVLYNPALDIALIADRLGDVAPKLSPLQHVKAGVAPTIIFHGKADTTVPYASAERFETAMKAAGNACKLVGYEGQIHGFFNYGRGDGSMYKATLAETDQFLVSLGWLKAAAK